MNYVLPEGEYEGAGETTIGHGRGGIGTWPKTGHEHCKCRGSSFETANLKNETA